MVKKTLVAVSAILAVAGAAAWIYHIQSGPSQRFDLNPYRALGAGVAEETAKLLGKGGQVVVVAPDTSQNPNPTVDGELDSFQETLKKNGLTVAATVRFKLTPQERMGTGGAVPGDQLFKLLESNPNIGAVVLFCAFPPLAAQDYDALRRSRIKFVVASGYLPGYRNLLETQVIHLAVVPRFDPDDSPAKKPQTLREWFESQFVVITPGTTATLPY